MFALRLLGGLSLESDTEPLPAGALQRRRLTLLALLALAGERGLSRERIQAHLWPESPADRARHALDQLLYATRRDLGHDAIQSGATELRLNPDVVRPDLWAFDEAVRAERWEEAVELHAGSLLSGQHLVDDAEYEHWLDAERMHREQEYHRALEALARSATARGAHDDAVRWWRRRAASDPLSAPAALQLMRALAAAGDRAGAIRHARAHQRLVRATLEAEPDPAVEALAATLATAVGAPGVAGGEGASPAPLPPPAPSAEPLAEPLAEPVGPSPTPKRAAATPAGARPRPRPARARLAAAGTLLATVGALTAAGLLVPDQPRAAPPRRAFTSRPEAAAPRPAALPNGTADPRARVLYLRAREAWNKRTKPALEEAVVLYRQATERDPEYAAAFTGLAESYAMLGYFGFGPGDAMFPKARAAALRALELDPADGEAYAPLGQALAWEHDWAGAERAYRRGLELAPRNPTVHQWYALMLAYVGRSREAAHHTGEAARLDPLSVQINNMYGAMLYDAGDLAGARRQFERTVVAEPDSAWVRQNPWVLSNYGAVEAAAGHHAQAVRLIELALQVVPTHPRPLLDLAVAYVRVGRPDSARAVFARADTTHPHYVVYRALLHAQLGEMDDAFAWLGRVREWPLPALVTLNSGPSAAAIRTDPRYETIRRRLALPAR